MQLAYEYLLHQSEDEIERRSSLKGKKKIEKFRVPRLLFSPVDDLQWEKYNQPEDIRFGENCL